MLRTTAFLAASALAAIVSSAAHAATEQKQGWEVGCAYRSPGPMTSEVVTRFYCERHKMCQDMANAKGGMMMEMGCFFVAPTGRTPDPAVAATRRTQQ